MKYHGTENNGVHPRIDRAMRKWQEGTEISVRFDSHATFELN